YWLTYARKCPERCFRGFVSNGRLLPSRPGPVARDQTRYHNRDEEDTGHTLQRGNDPHEGVQRNDPAITHAGQCNHAEIEKRSDLRGRNRLIERVVHEMIQDPIELRICRCDYQVANERFGDRIPWIVEVGVEMIEHGPKNRT